MKIQVTRPFGYGEGGSRETLEPGMVRDIPDSRAKEIIKQGWAKEYKEPK